MRSILFVGRRNAARSVMAETCFNSAVIGGWRAFSAGWQPQLEIDPLALRVLSSNGFPVDALSSKPVEVFRQAGAPQIDLCVFLDEVLPRDACDYPGEHAHWSVADPSASASKAGAAALADYQSALTVVTARVSALVLSGRLDCPAPVAIAS